MKRILTFFIVALVFTSCVKDDEQTTQPSPAASAPTNSYNADFMSDYFTLQCDIVRNTAGFLPTIAARCYGYLGVTAYESVVHGIAGGNSLAGQVQGFSAGSLPVPQSDKKYNWALASNVAMASIMRHMFGENLTPEDAVLIDEMEANTKASLSAGVEADVISRSEQYGADLAEAIYQISKTDGGDESHLNPWQTPWEVPEAPYCWVPTGGQAQPLSPNWMNNRSFIPNIAENTQVAPHIAFSTDEGSAFYAAALEVNEQVTNLNTPEQITIAEYWADDPFQTCTPTGHTFNIIKQLLVESNATLEKTAVAFGMMGIAENDAFISCWKSKYDYMLIRPVSYIQQNINPDFTTVIGTPPFPAYISGHSAEIGAGIKVMIDLFADAQGNYTFTDLSQQQYGFTPRSFDNFYDMAEECALSRFYGGIHYQMDNTVGLELGFGVGEAVLSEINWPQNIQ